MYRLSLLLAFCVACGPSYGLIDEGEDTSEWDGATLRIVSPGSGDFLALEESHRFEAQILDAEGQAMAFDDINWTTNVDSGWTHTGAQFEDSALPVGVHDITAEVELPNGDRLAHTVGGVLLQSLYAGTYSGLFHSEVTYDQIVVPCSGNVVIVVDPWGEAAMGDASCVTSLQGFEVELAYLFDLDNDEGELTGVAAADLFGWFQLDFPAEGTLNPEGDGLQLVFGGGDNSFIPVAGEVAADRVSLDAGL